MFFAVDYRSFGEGDMVEDDLGVALVRYSGGKSFKFRGSRFLPNDFLLIIFLICSEKERSVLGNFWRVLPSSRFMKADFAPIDWGFRDSNESACEL